MKVAVALFICVGLVSAGPPSITQVRDKAMKVLRGIRPDNKNSVPGFLQEASESSPKLSIQPPPMPHLAHNPALYHRAVPLNLPQPGPHGSFDGFGPPASPFSSPESGGPDGPFSGPPGPLHSHGGPHSGSHVPISAPGGLIPGPDGSHLGGGESGDRIYHQAESLLPNVSPDKLIHSNQHTIVYHKQPGEVLSDQELKGLHKIPKMPNGALPPQVIIQDDKGRSNGLHGSASGMSPIHGPPEGIGGHGISFGQGGGFGGPSYGDLGGGFGAPASHKPSGHSSRHYGYGHPRRPSKGSFGGFHSSGFSSGYGHGKSHFSFPHALGSRPGSEHGAGLQHFVFGGGSGSSGSHSSEREPHGNDVGYGGGKYYESGGNNLNIHNIPIMLKPPSHGGDPSPQSSRHQLFHQPVSFSSHHLSSQSNGNGHLGPLTFYQNPGPLPIMDGSGKNIIRYKTSPITVSFQKHPGSGDLGKPIVLNGEKAQFVHSFGHELDTAASGGVKTDGTGVIQVIIKPFAKDGKVVTQVINGDKITSESTQQSTLKESSKSTDSLVRAIPIFQFTINGQPVAGSEHLANNVMLHSLSPQFNSGLGGLGQLTPYVSLEQLQNDLSKMPFPISNSEISQAFGLQLPGSSFEAHSPVHLQSSSGSGSSSSSSSSQQGGQSKNKKQQQQSSSSSISSQQSKEKEKDGQQLTTLFQQTPHGITPLKPVYLPNSVVKSIMKQAGIKVSA